MRKKKKRMGRDSNYTAKPQGNDVIHSVRVINPTQEETNLMKDVLTLVAEMDAGELAKAIELLTPFLMQKCEPITPSSDRR